MCQAELQPLGQEQVALLVITSYSIHYTKLYDDANHWQSHWQSQHPHWLRVTDQQWDKPELAAWRDRVLSRLDASPVPLTLVAHSFGCLASLAAARLRPQKVERLFLVAPADPAKFGIPDPELAMPVRHAGLSYNFV